MMFVLNVVKRMVYWLLFKIKTIRMREQREEKEGLHPTPTPSTTKLSKIKSIQ